MLCVHVDQVRDAEVRLRGWCVFRRQLAKRSKPWPSILNFVTIWCKLEALGGCCRLAVVVGTPPRDYRYIGGQHDHEHHPPLPICAQDSRLCPW